MSAVKKRRWTALQPFKKVALSKDSLLYALSTHSVLCRAIRLNWNRYGKWGANITLPPIFCELREWELHEVNIQLQISLQSDQRVVTEPASSASDLNLEIVAYSGWQSGTAAGSGEIGSSGWTRWGCRLLTWSPRIQQRQRRAWRPGRQAQTV